MVKGNSSKSIKQAYQSEKQPLHKEPPSVWRPGINKIEPGDYLTYDKSCYDMLHSFHLDWPCLSFSIIPHSVPADYHEIYLVAGSQADRQHKNKIYIIKWSSSSQFDASSQDDSEVSEDEEITNNSNLVFCSIKNEGSINRIRSCPHIERLVANWSDNGIVSIWDISKQLDSLEASVDTPAFQCLHHASNPPLFTFEGHSTEGYALDWNSLHSGCLITGDCKGSLHLWEPHEGGWSISNGSRFIGHTQSIEDIQWKLKGKGCGTTFATASTDGILRIFDLKCGSPYPIQSIIAHNTDINVLNWNPLKEEMIVSSDDNGICKVWDIRFPHNELASINYHQDAISSVIWNPLEDSIFASSSYDGSISFWDLSVEPEDDFADSQKKEDFPDQLMFLHMGQEQISEIQYHPTMPGVLISTALDGFNILKTCNI